MDITVHGKQVDVGDALRARVEDRLRETNEKYFARATHATVTLSREGHGRGLFRVHVFVQVSQGISVNADATDPDPYAAFEKAADKAAKRWRRYKRKVRDDHKRDEGAALKARDFVLSVAPEPEGEEEDEAQGGDEPAIVAEMVAHIDTLSVANAVARMELAGQGALLFRNAGHCGLNMVYRRTDGHVGWVDPGPAPAKECCKKEGGQGCGGGGCGGGKGHGHGKGGCCG
jgi:ribosomal subunit interface protein